MRLFFLFFVFCSALLLNGCVFMNQEDRDFFGRGWINPSELDGPSLRSPTRYHEPPADPSLSPPTPYR